MNIIREITLGSIYLISNFIAVQITVIATTSKAKWEAISPKGLLRRFTPRNDNLKSNIKILIPRKNGF